ncbi:MAG: 4Fe-4S binding protein [Sterolibacterium sp.]|nr:4Fe-4S binding protein [Sterolibacterium sp.]
MSIRASILAVDRVIPIKPWSVQVAPGMAGALQRQRLYWQISFFVLFVMAPVLDLFRYDLDAGHAIIFGLSWRLGLDDFFAGRIDATQAGLNILLRLFLPLLGGVALFIAVAWRWGRLYCGWLCPHFSVVETINRLMRHASGKPSVWEGKPLPARNPDGSPFRVDARWWLVTVPLAIIFALLWAVVLLTYLLAPAEVYGNLVHLAPTPNQGIFIGAGTVVLSLDFLLARHLFCRFGCAAGLFQSLAWMGNRDAMVIGFQRQRAAECVACYRKGAMGAAACEAVCPMRLKPRVAKNQMFTCTQCAQCVAACATVQSATGTLLTWVDHEAARQNEARVSLTGNTD